jgi:hypothetical protein
MKWLREAGFPQYAQMYQGKVYVLFCLNFPNIARHEVFIVVTEASKYFFFHVHARCTHMVDIYDGYNMFIVLKTTVYNFIFSPYIGEGRNKN